MLKIGLTGGIGAGKSAVAHRLAYHGAVIIDADRIAREVVAPGTDGLAEVVARFGAQLLDSAGGLDRAALAEAVFGDAAARRALEEIIHPRVRARTAALTDAAAPDAIVVNDVPLLVEVGLAPTYHLVVVVEADESTRLARLTGRRDLTEAQARARIRAQTDDAARRSAADLVLPNDGPLADLHARVDALWHDRLVPFEQNIRFSRLVRRPERLHVAPYDPTWPQQYARLAARIRHAIRAVAGAGGFAGRLDHIGSTSVPGLAAKDVIDIQLTVPDLASADALAGALAEAGFPRYPGDWHDTPMPDAPDPSRWEKRLHGGTDPGRVVHLHVRAVGSPGWRLSLLLRDWLRADPAARREYAELKERLTAAGLSTSEYAMAKEPWFGQVWQRAQRWAADTGWAGPHA